ncbi:MAG: V-type ATPase subunit [Nitrososphaerota archaeon]|nr:V-type ATPase subunit [Nitrososphaerota archaeon]MDG6924258.1 V-type ATPase subunit [Nitrososphaerota archaeon]
MQASYAAGFGTLRVQSLNFLTKAQLEDLTHAKDVAEIAQKLESSWYGIDIEAEAAVHKPPELVEIAVNRHLIGVNKTALQACPVFGKTALVAYLSKWDIENIELVVAAKSLGRTLEQTESYLVSSRNIPLSSSIAAIPMSELNTMMQQPDVEAVINYLVKYGYGAILLQQLGDFRKNGDLGIFSSALQNYYYSKLLSELRFLQGDEGVLREYVRAEISKKNILNLLKSKELKIERDVFARHSISGGLLDQSTLLEAYSSPDLGDITKKFEPWFDLTGDVEKYQQSHNLTEFEVALDKMMVSRYMPKFRALSISLTTVFAFVFQAEFERQNIRRITYAKQYGMTEDYIRSIILSV